MDFGHWHWGQPITVFSFVLGIILLQGIFSVMRTRAKQSVLREAIRSGEKVDAELLRSLQDDKDDDDSTVLPGLILMAVAAGLSFLGWQIQKVEVDEPVFDILLGVASIPFLIGVVLFVAGLFPKKKKD